MSQISRVSKKQELLECIQPLNRGLVSLENSELQREVLSRVEALESLNPSPRPVEDPKIFGDWRTVYTTSASILGAKRPKIFQPVIVAQVIQKTESGIGITNLESIEPPGPFSIVNKITAVAKPDGYKRVDVQFQKFQLANSLISLNVADNPRFANWLDTTYLDEEMRISRGGEGNVFVLLRAGEDDVDLPL